jgi:hypothetical protein
MRATDFKVRHKHRKTPVCHKMGLSLVYLWKAFQGQASSCAGR